MRQIPILVYGLLMSTGFRAQTAYTLQQSLQAAKANNPVLKTQHFNVNIAEADLVTAKLRPNLVLNNQSLQLMKPSYFPANTRWSDGRNRQVWWQLTKTFELPAQRKYRVETAEKNIDLSQGLYSETERNLLQEVAGKWLDAWTAMKQLNVLQSAKNNMDSLVYINKHRFRNQVITQTDLSRTELLAGQYALRIKSAEQSYRNELAALKFLLGTQGEISVDTSDSFNLVFSANMDSVLEEAFTNRADLQSLKSSIEAAGSNIKLQKARAWPSPELGAIYNPQNTIPYVGFYGTIQIPLFSRNQGEIKKSYLLKQQSEQDLNTVQQQIRTEIYAAFNSYQVQKANLQNFSGLIAQSESILSNVKYAYLKGGTNIIDYLEAQRSWLDTQQQYYEALQLYRSSSIQLLYASGLINKMAQ